MIDDESDSIVSWPPPVPLADSVIQQNPEDALPKPETTPVRKSKFPEPERPSCVQAAIQAARDTSLVGVQDFVGGSQQAVQACCRHLPPTPPPQPHSQLPSFTLDSESQNEACCMLRSTTAYFVVGVEIIEPSMLHAAKYALPGRLGDHYFTTPPFHRRQQSSVRWHCTKWEAIVRVRFKPSGACSLLRVVAFVLRGARSTDSACQRSPTHPL